MLPAAPRREFHSSTERGRLTAVDAESAVANLYFVDTIDVKLELFRCRGAVMESETAILASNTSSIPIVKHGAVSRRAAHVVGVHFFIPPPVMSLVELIPSPTSRETLQRCRTLIGSTLDKQIIEAADRAGFVVNLLLMPYLLSAVRLEAGYALASDIDRGMQLGCGHPTAPLALSDLSVLTRCAPIGRSMYEEHKEPLYAPPPLLDRTVAAGLLGQKSGRGFHAYERTV